MTPGVVAMGAVPEYPLNGQDVTGRSLMPGMRWMLYVAAFLVLGAGLDLYLFAEQTALLFAWPIDPPLTAAFLGANYLASGVVEFGAARQPTWARARVAVPTVLLFTTLTTWLTMLNLDYLSWGNPMAWIWLAVYFGVPPVLGVLWWKQEKKPGQDAVRALPLPQSLRGTLSVSGLAMLTVGLALIFLPGFFGWPWVLTPPNTTYGSIGSATMETYVGVWLLSWGTLLLHAAWENDFLRIRYVFAAFLILAVLQGIAVVRYGGVITENFAGRLPYLAALTTLGLLGLWGELAARRARGTARSPRPDGG